MATKKRSEQARIKNMLLLNMTLIFLGSLFIILGFVYYSISPVKKETIAVIILATLSAGALCISLLAVLLNRMILRHMQKTDRIQKQLKEQLDAAGQMSALGRMDAGVVHEINNPLQIIQSEEALIAMNLEILKENGALELSKVLVEIEDSLAQIKKQVEHCAGITRSVLTFSRRISPETQPVSLQELVPEVLLLAARQAEAHRVRMATEIPPDLPPVSAEAFQLKQVLLNLLNNAVYAIQEQHGAEGGQIKVTGQDNEKGEVTVSVTDNGSGISPEDLDRVFTPFFSTKPVGKGTGLGLAVCYGIIENLGGRMNVSSRPKEGTTFHIHLKEADSLKSGTV